MSSENTCCNQDSTQVTYHDLPLHCPTTAMSVWNAHPRVFLAIEETGQAQCPYCGTRYVLTDWDPNRPAGH